MNIFRIVGDLLHLLSFLILIRKIYHQKSCAGISLKTQELYALVFVTRYIDIFYNFMSIYNWILKIIFLGSTFTIIYMIRVPYNHTYDKQGDRFQLLYLIVPCAILALFINHEFEVTEILWAFSIYLEAVSILPQLFLLARTGEIDLLTGDYIFTLGGYRFMYILNWVYRLSTDTYYRPQWIVWISGVVQTLLYADFFYYYLKSKINKTKLVLPS
eukprot:TRINITY_DN16197_c0_g1_i1.p1 TRINITY_DN16197_c0_g1~~TRINITY_DN16197_c0_g1_i1.p1  ORF type:complete len:225 (+),score=12.52 TRINITY_DN16197_c0_g1_i1:32-676(+)